MSDLPSSACGSRLILLNGSEIPSVKQVQCDHITICREAQLFIYNECLQRCQHQLCVLKNLPLVFTVLFFFIFFWEGLVSGLEPKLSSTAATDKQSILKVRVQMSKSLNITIIYTMIWGKYSILIGCHFSQIA